MRLSVTRAIANRGGRRQAAKERAAKRGHPRRRTLEARPPPSHVVDGDEAKASPLTKTSRKIWPRSCCRRRKVSTSKSMRRCVIVTIVERYLADYRDPLEGDEQCRDGGVEILDLFIESGMAGRAPSGGVQAWRLVPVIALTARAQRTPSSRIYASPDRRRQICR